ncbi:MAG: hypothetical protein ABGW77_06610 [Campylobacterales bacterium]
MERRVGRGKKGIGKVLKVLIGVEVVAIASWGVSNLWKISAKHLRIGASYDTLDHTISTTTSIRIEFPSLYTRESWEEENFSTKTPFTSALSQLKGNTLYESSTLQLGIPFLRWHKGVLIGVKNRGEVTRQLPGGGKETFSSELVLTGTQKEEQSYWLNGVGVEGSENSILYFWNLTSKWFYWGDILELSTSLTVADSSFPELKGGGGLSYSTGDRLVGYRLYTFQEFPGEICRQIGGVIFGYTTRKPVFYGYKIYTQFQWNPTPYLHFIGTPYLLYSKEHNFKLKPALSLSLYYQY